MEKVTKNGASVPGTETPNLAQVQQWLSRDLGSAILCLQAIQSDQDLLAHLSTFMLGRLENKLAKPDPAQINLGI